MAQKIIKIGSSAGVTLSRDALEALGVRIGDTVEVSAHPSASVVTVRHKRKVSDVDPDVITWANAFIDKNRVLLKRLAGK